MGHRARLQPLPAWHHQLSLTSQGGRKGEGPKSQVRVVCGYIQAHRKGCWGGLREGEAAT